jgi:hypothetical protein
MLKNIGSSDRVIRIVLALAIILLYLTNKISGIAAIILGVIAIVLLLTSFISYCPLYVPFKISTRKKD